MMSQAEWKYTDPSRDEQCPDCGSTETTAFYDPDAAQQSIGIQQQLVAYCECDVCGSRFNDNQQEFDSVFRAFPGWEAFFPYEAPYDHQYDAIERVIETAIDDGFMVVEGACGTGKTLIGLIAGSWLVNNPSTKYEQVLVLTSVKQQLKQFENDLRQVNQAVTDEFYRPTSVTMVGKGDLCPYARAGGVAGITESNLGRRCSTLRAQTKQMMKGKQAPSGHQINSQVAPENSAADRWEVDGKQAPFTARLPVVDGEEACPFYAKFEQNGTVGVQQEDARDQILDADELVRLGLESGTCPHSAMTSGINKADIVIGNYTHAFDYNTLRVTHRLLDDSTFLICDEAHMLEPRVRGILSEDITIGGLRKAYTEVERVLAGVDEDFVDSPPSNPVAEGYLYRNLEEYGVAHLQDALTFLKHIGQASNDLIERVFYEDLGGPASAPASLPNQHQIELRDPSTPGQDKLTQWVTESGVPGYITEHIGSLAGIVSDTLELADGGGSRYAIDVGGSLLESWFAAGHTAYFRMIELQRCQERTQYDPDDWRRYYRARLKLENVMPQRAIRSRLNDFGGGLLMSATLEPLDVYTEVIGLDDLEEQGRTVNTARYDVEFPSENQLSLTVDLPAYTSSNRDSDGSSDDVREQYAAAVEKACAHSPGNALVAMPSYAEAEWIAEELAARLDRPVLSDESSSEEATKALKEEFFAGGPKVLTTSLRGTLTEGVDYSGEKLVTAVVCGVPIENVESPSTKALHAGYESQFGSYKLGFEYGLTVPAVRKARQALGRVIRGEEDVGTRILIDHRYATEEGRNTVKKFLSEEETDYQVVDSVGEMEESVAHFWDQQ